MQTQFLMRNKISTIYFDVEKAIDYAFDGKFILKFYDYLASNDTKGYEVEEFIQSSTALSINEIINEIDEYIKGGQDSTHKTLREAYGHIPKPQARKIKNYLLNIIEDAWRYKYDKRPGRRKKDNK